jgi:photosystem II stability/assembly factor-like uncharacterized protein
MCNIIKSKMEGRCAQSIKQQEGGIMVMVFTLVSMLVAAPCWHVKPFSYQVNDVDMINPEDGWACGTVGYLQNGFLHYDGTEWYIAAYPAQKQILYSIDMVDNKGWAVGEQFNFPDGIIYEYDMDSWTQSDDPLHRALHAVSFPDAEVGWAVGACDPQYGQILKYENGIWQFESTTIPSSVILRDVHFASRDFGIAVGIDQTTWKAAICECIEGKWQLVNKVPNVPMLHSAWAFPDGSALACGSDGYILRRVGGSWRIVWEPPFLLHLYDLHMFSANEGWAVGNNGTVLKCSEGMWAIDTVFSSLDVIACVSFANPAYGWLFSYDFMPPYYAAVYCDEPEPVKGSTKSNRKIVELVSSQYSKNIRLKFEQGNNACVSLYDCSGRKCISMNNDGREFMEISTKGLSAGVYILQIENSNARESHKIIVY